MWQNEFSIHFDVLLKSDLGIQQTEASLLNKSSYLDSALGVTKWPIIIHKFWLHFVLMLKSDLGLQQTEACLWDQSSFLDAALGVN